MDTAWTAIDIVTIAAAFLSGGAALPAPVVSVGIHLSIKVIDHVIDGGLPTDLTNVYLEGVNPDLPIQFEPLETREFTMFGTFESQETIIESAINIIIETCLAEIGEWLPDTVKSAIFGMILDVLSNLGLEGWMSFLGDNFTSIGAIPPFDLKLDFDFFDSSFDLNSMINRTMFQGCTAPMVALLASLGNFFCDSGIRTSCESCLEWDIDFEKISLTVTGDFHGVLDVIYFRWFTYRPFVFGLEIPTSDPLDHQVCYQIHISDSPDPTPTTSPPTSTPTSGPGTPTPTPAPTNFVYIPPGTFQMGSPSGEMCRDSDETQHQVTLTHGFYIQSTEVTQQQWVDVFGNNPSYNPGMSHPVEKITWYDACIYSNRLSTAGGLTPCYYSDESYSTVFDGTPPVTSGTVYWNQNSNGYRLPTESEWEYACRAGTTTAYNSGQTNTSCYDEDPNLDPLAWYFYNSGHESHDVGLKQPNNWELYDMHGNVWEWCWDWYGSYPTGSVTDPTGSTSSSYRVIRGGGCHNYAYYCRSANRSSYRPGYHYYYLGFRILRATN